MATIEILQNLSLNGALTFLENNAEFPASPQVGMIVLKGEALYAYVKIGDLYTWYPMSNKTRSYIHTQGLASTQWNITHNLGSAQVWTQIQDVNGRTMYATTDVIDANNVRVTFSEGKVGTVIIVAPDDIQVPQVTATLIKVGNNVELDTTGLKINGEYITGGGAGTSSTAGVTTVAGRDGDVILYASDITGLSAVATTGNYTDLINAPTIPTLTSQLTNNSNYVTSDALGANNGIATLDSSGKLNSIQLPAIAVTDTYVVASEAAMLALSAAEVGDVAVRADINKSFILSTAGYSTLANWQELLTPTSTVTIPYDFGGMCIGKPNASEVLMKTVIARSCSIPVNFGGSVVVATAPTNAVTLSIKKNGVEIGTMSIASGATTGTFSESAAISFVPGDILTVSAEATQDATFADIAFTIIANI